jgi:catechol 2,3-dioxygenase-like lactoylglutathione lyase family enzyme
MSEFMTAVLGFRVSDYAYVGGEQALVFLRCDADHHAAGIGRGTDGLFHVAFEVDSMAELARLADALGREGRCLSWGPGRHGAGDNVATYHTDPSGVPIEVFWDMQRIDDEAWQPRTWSFEDYRFINHGDRWVTYPACSGSVSRTSGKEGNRRRKLAVPSVSPVHLGAIARRHFDISHQQGRAPRRRRPPGRFHPNTAYGAPCRNAIAATGGAFAMFGVVEPLQLSFFARYITANLC